MISLDWANKAVTPPKPVKISQFSLVYPHAKQLDGNPVNKLIYGDNFEILSTLLPVYQEKVDLIYIDPPFFTNRKFSARVGKGEDSRKPKDWQLGKGYGDTWQGLDAYIQFLYERLNLAYQLLAPTGSIYLHLDWHANSYARLILDELFGADRVLNEIVWTYHGPSPIRTAFNRKHDTILSYTKTENYTFNVDDVRVEYNQNTVKTFNSSTKAGFGKVPDLERGKVPEDWWYFPVVARLHNERTGYPTQKPEKLVERIIKASSNPGDLVLDFFAGSGTTATVAAKCDRNFITTDASPISINICAERLIRDGGVPFSIEHTPTSKPELVMKNDIARVDGDIISLLYEENVMTWEVGYTREDGVFISQNQRTRPYREKLLDTALRISLKAGQTPAVLVTDRENNHYFQAF